ncbi:MAG: flavodoxin reductase [Chromatiales bacterium 21-64-14]|nr:MAG: flavodoxin reductase [Chromatiales bacterium 21-64-14]HQU17042.1 FAD-binding oxidoreductase [Gammaproteobacteria bacterium]
MTHKTTLLMKQFVTHDVLRFIVARPEGFAFEPGQGLDLAIDHERWRQQTRPFTPTSVAQDKVLEFTIKIYEEHAGVTRALAALNPGAGLTISDPWGTIRYQGRGVFIAGGAGITPFLAIMRQLRAEGRLDGHGLIFSNKSPSDVICEKELRAAFGERATFVTDREAGGHFIAGRVDETLLRRCVTDWSQRFYVCGPPPFNDAVMQTLRRLGAQPDTLIFEQ